MGIGRRLRRAVRRISRSVERAVRDTGGFLEDNIRRSVRMGEDLVRGIGDGIGAIPILGDVVATTGLVETPAMKAAEKQAEAAEKQAEANRQLIKDQQAQQQRIEEADRQAAQDAAAIQNTQNKTKSGGGVASGAYANALTGESSDPVAQSEDKLKKLLKRNV